MRINDWRTYIIRRLRMTEAIKLNWKRWKNRHQRQIGKKIERQGDAA